MPLSDLSTSHLKKLIHLVQQKESLQARLSEVNATLAQLDGAPAQPTQKRGPRKVTRRKGTTLKDAILTVLSQAGPKGLSVKEIAAQAKAKLGSVSVWIYTSGKKVAGLKKIAPGIYTYQKS